MVTGTLKGNVLVDVNFPNSQNFHVVLDSKNEFNGIAWDCTMNQSDLKNNNNKYYIIQLLQHDNNISQYYVWNRWGRVGYDGQSASFPAYSFDQAKKMFMKKYNEKSGRGYTPLVMDYSSNNYNNISSNDSAPKNKKREK